MKYFLLASGLILMFSGFIGANGEWPRLGMSAIFVGLGLSVVGVKEWRQSRRNQIDYGQIGDLEDEKIALLNAGFDKARQDMLFIENTRRELTDKDLARRLGSMQQTAGNMLRYLQKNPQKMPQAQKFIDYYQDRAAVLVGKYREFETMELSTDEMNDMKQKLKESIVGLEAAYNDQFQRVLRDQFIDMNAEMAVINQAMDMDGVKRNVTPGSSSPGLDETIDTKFTDLTVPRREIHEARKIPYGNSIIPSEQKNDVIMTKLIQSALAIFLGGFGAHKFYQGKTFQGIIYCLLCWSFLPEFIGFCEGIRYLVMKLDDFYVDYYLPRNK